MTYDMVRNEVRIRGGFMDDGGHVFRINIDTRELEIASSEYYHMMVKGGGFVEGEFGIIRYDAQGKRSMEYVHCLTPDNIWSSMEYHNKPYAHYDIHNEVPLFEARRQAVEERWKKGHDEEEQKKARERFIKERREELRKKIKVRKENKIEEP